MTSSLATIVARGLTLSIGPRILVEGIDLSVGPGTRLGLVGPNGAGKSTLLRTLAGLRPPDGGEVRLSPGTATVGYLPQEPSPRPGETVGQLLERRTGVAEANRALDAATAALAEGDPGSDDAYALALDRWMALGGADLDARAGAVADDLGLPTDLLGRPVASLSGGQAARAQLAALLLARFDVFLLDEPTNDLDIDGLDRLQAFVDGLAGPSVIVSHDRAFLERTVTAVAEIDEHTHSISRIDGGWEAFLVERQRARRHAEEAHAVYVDKRDNLRDRATTQRNWSSKGIKKVKTSGETDKHIRHFQKTSSEHLAAKARQTERAMERLDVVDKPFEGWDLRMTIADAGRSGDVVARLDGAVVERPGVDGRPGFRLGPVSLTVDVGDRLAVVGRNGSGKTTLLEALLGRAPLAEGQRWMGPGVVVGEISQGREVFDGAATLLAGFQARTGIVAVSQARSLLAKFGLGADHVARTAGSLSPGERTRATLAVLQAVGVNLLVLDEPTNHLDLPAIEQLEQAVGTFGGTLILVTHDRRLLEGIGITRRIQVTDGEVREVPEVVHGT